MFYYLLLMTILGALINYVIESLLIGIVLWLISLILPYTFSWLHAFVLTAIIMILRFIFEKEEG